MVLPFNYPSEDLAKLGSSSTSQNIGVQINFYDPMEMNFEFSLMAKVNKILSPSWVGIPSNDTRIQRTALINPAGCSSPKLEAATNYFPSDSTDLGLRSNLYQI